MPFYFAGIDIGVTKTEGVLLSEDRLQIEYFRVKRGSSFQITETTSLRHLVEDVINELLKTHRRGKVELLTLGIAGVFREKEREFVYEALRAINRVDRMVVVSDAEIAHYAAFEGAPGVLIIAGTGSIVIGLDKNGKLHRLGGYGYIIGDIGSASWIGLEGIKRVIAHMEGMGGDTALTQRIVDYLKIETPYEIVPILYRQDSIPGFLGSIAEIVSEASKDGDSAALEIINR